MAGAENLSRAHPPDDAHSLSAGGPARAEGRNPSAEVSAVDLFPGTTSEASQPNPGERPR